MSHLEIKPCHFGVIFALGIEAGPLEDLLCGAVRIRSRGFSAREGGLKGRRTVIARSGAGQKNAARATELLIDGHRPSVVISAGFAGGLDQKLKRHDILLPDQVIDASGGQIILEEADRRLQYLPNWPGLHRGKLLTADHVVREPIAKQALFQQHQAQAVDMETFAAAEVCQRRGVPLLAVRIILDAAADALPPYVERLLCQKSKAARLGAALAVLWRRPSSFKDFWA